MCHEVGHAIGLGHAKNRGCMNGGNIANNPDFDQPAAGDFDRLRNIYDHRHSQARIRAVGTGRTEPIAIERSVSFGPTVWTVVESEHVLDLGGGRTKITYALTATWELRDRRT